MQNYVETHGRASLLFMSCVYIFFICLCVSIIINERLYFFCPFFDFANQPKKRQPSIIHHQPSIINHVCIFPFMV